MPSGNETDYSYKFANFEAEICVCDPKSNPNYEDQTFVNLPKEISDLFKRRGRTSARIEVNGLSFECFIEPDGNLSHWFIIPPNIAQSAKLEPKTIASFGICPLDTELEPIVPKDLELALEVNPIAQIGWEKTTTIVRIDWVHWIETARQEKTRTKRINDAINMLEQGKLRVCCFDNSGFYSKAFRAPIPLNAKT